MLISILICTYNKAKSLEAVLKNLNQINIPTELVELQIVVDGSQDNTLEIIKKTKINVQYQTHFIPNSGLVKARNFGIEKSKGDYILFCDDDVHFSADYFSFLLDSIKQKPKSIHIGNLVNINEVYSNYLIEKVVKNDNPNFKEYINYQSKHDFFEAVKCLFVNKNQYEDFKTASWWAVVTGGNICIPVGCLKEVGGFDPEIKGWGPEDADLCYRIFKKGYDATYNENCLLYHLDHKRNNKKLSETLIKNALYFYKKYNKPKELYEYLRFMNGMISLKEYNDICCKIFNIKEINIPPFYMGMESYINNNQIIKYSKNDLINR